MKTQAFFKKPEGGMNVQALAEREQRYSRLLAAVTDYVYSVTIEEGQVVATEHSDCCQNVTGYTPAEFDADPLLWWSMIHEQDRPAVLAQAQQARIGENPSPLEHRIRHKNGTIRWIRNTPVPNIDSQGRLTGYDGLVTDITELKESEARFRSLMEAAPDAMVIVDEAHKITLVNGQAERMFGYDREQLVGKRVDVLVPESLRSRHAELSGRYMASPAPRPMGEGGELLALRKDGTEFPVEISLSPLATEHGNLFVAALRDISKRRQVERHLKESEEYFRQMAENIREVFWMTDVTKNQMLYVSPAYEAI
jgi:sigma-B regulation protein RsbU (phosphoserine phosphatase)